MEVSRLLVYLQFDVAPPFEDIHTTDAVVVILTAKSMKQRQQPCFGQFVYAAVHERNARCVMLASLGYSSKLEDLFDDSSIRPSHLHFGIMLISIHIGWSPSHVHRCDLIWPVWVASHAEVHLCSLGKGLRHGK
jgi:hypothetical protein